MNNKKSITVREDRSVSLVDMQTMAKSIAESGMFGVKTEAQAMALMLLCQAEGIHPVMALRRYHIIENKPAYRADALQGEFEREGAILWHVRDEKECSATFWRRSETMDDKSMMRARERYKALRAGKDASGLAMPGELTIIRSMADAIEKQVATTWENNKQVLKKNWRQSPRQMLHARCLTEGVRAINPGLVAGIYTEDEIHDFDQLTEHEFERTPSEMTERNVREATANAVAEGGTADQTQSRDGVTETTVRDAAGNVLPLNAEQAGWSVYGPQKITQENYKDRIAHFGKPTGRIIGRKVGDLEKPVIEWLMDKWIPSLNPSSSEDDMALKMAIEFAFKNLQKGGDAISETQDLRTGGITNAAPTVQSAGAAVNLGD